MIYYSTHARKNIIYLLNIYCFYLYYFSARVCSPAIPLPSVEPPCNHLNIQLGSCLKNHGVTVDSYVFRTPEYQHEASLNAIRYEAALKEFTPLYGNILGKNRKCTNVIRTFYYRYFLPSCDRTGRKTQEQKPCKTTCDYFVKICKNVLEVVDDLNQSNLNCTAFPTREAGGSPECWYYDEKVSGKQTNF